MFGVDRVVVNLASPHTRRSADDIRHSQNSYYYTDDRSDLHAPSEIGLSMEVVFNFLLWNRTHSEALHEFRHAAIWMLGEYRRSPFNHGFLGDDSSPDIVSGSTAYKNDLGMSELYMYPLDAAFALDTLERASTDPQNAFFMIAGDIKPNIQKTKDLALVAETWPTMPYGGSVGSRRSKTARCSAMPPMPRPIIRLQALSRDGRCP